MRLGKPYINVWSYQNLQGLVQREALSAEHFKHVSHNLAEFPTFKEKNWNKTERGGEHSCNGKSRRLCGTTHHDPISSFINGSTNSMTETLLKSINGVV